MQHPPPSAGMSTFTHPLIGISGRKRAGKDTLAGHVVSEYQFRRVSFADPLRDVLAKTNPVVGMVREDRSGACSDPGCCGGPFEDDFPLRLDDALFRHRGWEGIKDAEDDEYWPGWVDLGDEVRGLLQRLGTAIRDLDPDFWVRTALSRAASLGRPVVIPDVRFPNEFDAIRRAGGIVVRVERPGLDTTGTTSSHVSETALDKAAFDLRVLNVGTPDDLSAAAEVAVRMASDHLAMHP